MEEVTTNAKLLLGNEEEPRDVRLTVVREEDGKVSLSAKDFVLVTSIAAVKPIFS